MANSREMERLFRRTWSSWPTFLTDSHGAAWKAWQGLTQEERNEAAERSGDYVNAVRDAGGSVCTFGVYLAEKRWKGLPRQEVPFDEFATPFSKAWCAWILAHLLTSADQAGEGWPLVAALFAAARRRKGARFARRWHELGAGFEPVPVRSTMFEAWQALFKEKGWPWFPDTGQQPVLFFPKGGPEGLTAFELAILGEEWVDDGGECEAAE